MMHTILKPSASVELLPLMDTYVWYTDDKKMKDLSIYLFTLQIDQTYAKLLNDYKINLFNYVNWAFSAQF